MTAYRDALGKQIALDTFELDRLVSLRDIWLHWEALLRGDYSPENLPAWQELAERQLSDLRQTEALRQAQVSDLQIQLESLASRISQLPLESQARAALKQAEQALNKVYSGTYRPLPAAGQKPVEL